MLLMHTHHAAYAHTMLYYNIFHLIYHDFILLFRYFNAFYKIVRLQHFSLDLGPNLGETMDVGLCGLVTVTTEKQQAENPFESKIRSIVIPTWRIRTMSKTENGGQVFENVFQNIRNAAEANLKMQQEAFQQWSSLWPGVPTSQPAWVDKVQKFHKQWSDTVSSLAAKRREVLDEQYKAAVESLDTALKVTEATNPEEFRRRSEQFCRKTVDCMRDIAESQVREFQDSAAKWTKLVTKV